MKGGNIMHGLMFVDVPLEAWTRLLYVYVSVIILK